MTHRSAPKRWDWRKRLGFSAIGLMVLATTTGCSDFVNDIIFIDLPAPTTVEGESIKTLWEGNWIAAWLVGIFVWGLMVFCMIAYSKRRRPDVPRQTEYNMPIETMYTVIPLIMVLGLFWFAQKEETEILEIKGDEQHTINVVGFRWSWGFNYPEGDVYDIGQPVDFTQPDGSLTQNQDAAPTLWLPVDEKVRIELTSPDVIHSFWVVDWLFKMDVIPGKLNEFAVTPNQVGWFEGRCAELCGVDHSRMLFNVRVVPRAEYEAYLQELRDRGQTGQLDTGRVNVSGEPNVDGRVL